MQQWEYKVISISYNQNAQQQETLINQLGIGGWELVGIMSGSLTGTAPSILVFGTLYFKRPKP